MEEWCDRSSTSIRCLQRHLRPRVYVSITHERTHAAAVAIVERIVIHRSSV